MKKQVVVIHGGRTFKTYQEYIRSIRNREVSIDKFKIQKNWKDSLEKKLGKNFEVFAPHMPNGNNAVYEEWKIWFCRMVEFINDDAIFIGHSLGGIFLAKYICENTCSKKIKAVILVAAPFNEGNMKEFNKILPTGKKPNIIQLMHIMVVNYQWQNLFLILEKMTVLIIHL